MTTSRSTQEPLRPTIFTYRKLWMEGPKVNQSNRPSSFHFGITKGNPRCTVYYNDDKTDPIVARMEVDSFILMLDILEGLANKTLPGKMYKIECKHTYRGDEKLPEPTIMNKVVMGRNKHDEIYITVVQEGLEPIPFIFTNNFWYNIVDKDNNAVDPVLVSEILVRSKVKLIRDLLALELKDSLTEIEEDRKRRAEEWKAKKPQQGQRREGGSTQRAPSTPPTDDYDDVMTF